MSVSSGKLMFALLAVLFMAMALHSAQGASHAVLGFSRAGLLHNSVHEFANEGAAKEASQGTADIKVASGNFTGGGDSQGSAISGRSAGNIAMVTSSLKDILSSVRSQEEQDKKQHDEYIDLCTQKISDLNNVIGSSQSALQAAQGSQQTAMVEVDGLIKALKQNKRDAREFMDQMSQAQNIRYAEQDKYNQDMMLNTQSINQVSKAIDTLSNVQKAGGFLQNGFIQKLKLNNPGDSGMVLGVMKGIMMKLQKTKVQLEKTEQEKSAAYNSFVKSNQATLTSLQSQIIAGKQTLTQKKIDLNSAARKVKAESKNMQRLDMELTQVQEDKSGAEKDYEIMSVDHGREKAALKEAIRHLESELGEHTFVQQSTAMTQAVRRGATSIMVPTGAADGMHEGDNIVVGSDTREETNVIVGFGSMNSIHLLHALEHDHPPSTVIKTLSPDDARFEIFDVDRAEQQGKAEHANSTTAREGNGLASSASATFVDVSNVTNPYDPTDDLEEDTSDGTTSVLLQMTTSSIARAHGQSVTERSGRTLGAGSNTAAAGLSFREHEKQDEFGALQQTIKDLLQAHTDTQKEEADRKKYCGHEIAEGEKRKDDTQDEVELMNATIEQKSAKVAQLTQELAGFESFIATEKVMQDRAKQVRTSQKLHYDKQSKDRTLAVQVLEHAKQLLADFYERKNEEAGLRRTSIQSNAVISLLAQISGDITKEQSDASREEEGKITAYENSRTHYREMYDHKIREITECKQEKGKLRVQINSHIEKRDVAMQALREIEGTLASLHGACDELLHNYDARKNNRRFEMNQLLDIQDILAGSTLSVRTNG